MARQKLFESQLNLAENGESQPPQIKPFLVLTTALFAAGAVLLAWFAVKNFYGDWTKSYVLNSFLTIESLAGIYLYRNTSTHRLTHSLLTILAVPIIIFVFFLTVVILDQMLNISYFGSDDW